MKKRIITVLLALSIFSLTACSTGVGTEVVEKEKTVLQQIEGAETFEEITEFSSYRYDTEEKKMEFEALENRIKEYFEKNLSGYYYDTNFQDGEMIIDSIAIYVVNQEEVYVLANSEEMLNMQGKELSDLPNIENSDEYKYHFIGGKSINSSDTSDGISVMELYMENDNDGELKKEIKIRYSETGGYLMITDSLESYGYDKYSFSETEAVDEMNKVASDLKEELDGKEDAKNAEPAIGMTKDEVLNGAWGEPDKKNIDEYEWGTEEQWVYEGKGYVYFEDGVVTAIQHR